MNMTTVNLTQCCVVSLSFVFYLVECERLHSKKKWVAGSTGELTDIMTSLLFAADLYMVRT
jgi:hypothetical protein